MAEWGKIYNKKTLLLVVFILLGIITLLVSIPCPDCPNVCNISEQDFERFKEIIPERCNITDADLERIIKEIPVCPTPQNCPDCNAFCPDTVLTDLELQKISKEIPQLTCLPKPSDIALFVSLAIGFISFLIAMASGKKEDKKSSSIAGLGALVIIGALLYLGLTDYAIFAFISFIAVYIGTNISSGKLG